MVKNMHNTPIKKKKSISNIYKKNKNPIKNSNKKIIKEKSPHLTKASSRQSKNLIENTTIIQKKSPNKNKLTKKQWKNTSRSLSLENSPKDTQNREEHNQDLQMDNDKNTIQNWKDISQSRLQDRILNRSTKGNQTGKNKAKKEKNLIKRLNEKQEEWFKGLIKTLENSMKNLTNSQKKALNNIGKSLLDNLSSKDKENEILKEMILNLFSQNGVSKDMQNLGEIKISTEERESYL